MLNQHKLSHILLKALIIILLGSGVGLIYNTLSPSGITLKGNWSPRITTDSLVMKFQSKNVIFLDARYPKDFRAGHIKGAINLPYEEYEEHAPQVLPKLPKDHEIIAYCDGTECETSLLLARELVDLGYEDVKVFFGGWQEWQDAGLSVEAGE
jgi:rhodanese-related sulfurtransferase